MDGWQRSRIVIDFRYQARGRIQILATSLAVVQPHRQSDRVKVLAVTSRQRLSAPDVPTVAEASYPELELESPVGVFGTCGMVGELRERVTNELRIAIAADPTVAVRIEATRQIITVSGPAEFATVIKGLRDMHSAVVEVLGIEATQ
jgi:tripartite-type tricarboxylate transporter receptor subunit TctC